MQRPKFFEDLDRSLAGLDIEDLKESQEEQRRRATDLQRIQEVRARIAINNAHYNAQATSIVLSQMTLLPPGWKIQ